MEKPLIDFSGRVALITGAAGGIGTATAKLFAERGARVTVVDLMEPPVGRWWKADVRNFEEVKTCVSEILRAEKQIDFLVNNAGIFRDTPSWKMTEEDWDAVLDVNLKGAFNFIRHLAPHFRERKTGKIVNVASINGLRGKFGQANYAASKAGLVGLTKTIARELARSNINVNAVAPGLIHTPLIAAMSEDARAAAMQEILLGRIGTPEDVAQVIAFLCSDMARHITGEVIKVDGGQYI